jgi:hypothetical protein
VAESHQVAPLIYFNLRQYELIHKKIPPTVVEKFKNSLHQNIIIKEKLAERITWALSFFKQRSIDVMIIKGAILDILVYDQPWYTVSDDIDLVISRTPEQIPDHEQREFMEFFHRSAVEYDYFEHHDVTMNNVLAVDFNRIWRDATQIVYREESAWIMSPEDMLISLCVNSCRKRFFRLRSLVDIAETINKYPNLDWIEFARKAGLYDCQNIVYTALLITQMTVGCNLPDKVYKNLAVNPVRSVIIRFFVHYILWTMSLYTIYPFSGKTIFGREVNPSLVLPYAVYRPYQIIRKIKEIYRAWR